jgi:hypothetical protein
MAWARLDDSFHDHPKVIELLDHEEGAAALGLWILAWSWAHRNTRKPGQAPGRIPAGLPRRLLGQQGRDLAKLLVSVGLWEDATDEDGNLLSGGWQIHDFDAYLPSAETRAARSEAGKRGAAKRWGSSTGNGADTLPFPDSNEPSGDSNEPSNGMAKDAIPVPVPNKNSSSVTATPPPDGDNTSSQELEGRDDVEQLCQRLVDRMVANGCKRPTVTKRWRTEARLLLDKDGRDFQKALGLIDWCQQDSFWKSNIHSIPKFREKYDTLRQQAREEWKRRNGSRPGLPPQVSPHDEWRFA